MAKRMAATRVVLAIGISAGAAIGFGAAYGPHARADDPRPEAAAPAKTVEGARQIVRDLEAQAEAQRAQLEKTEATLERARALLRGLEEDAVVDEDLRRLKVREDELARKLAEFRKRSMHLADPAYKFTQQMLDRLRDEIRGLERSHGLRP